MDLMRKFQSGTKSRNSDPRTELPLPFNPPGVPVGSCVRLCEVVQEVSNRLRDDYLVSLAPRSRLQAQAAHGGGADKGALVAREVPRKRS